MLGLFLALIAAAPAASPAPVSATTVGKAKKPPVDKDATDGLSGLPIPRFVSVKSDQAYLRTGPGNRYPVEWVYVRKGLPVEVVREYGIWRQVRDIGGTVGWLNKQLVSGNRTAVVIGTVRPIFATPDLQGRTTWRIATGAIVRILLCDHDWCRVDRGGHSGYILRAQLWGVSPTEQIG